MRPRSLRARIRAPARPRARAPARPRARLPPTSPARAPARPTNIHRARTGAAWQEEEENGEEEEQEEEEEEGEEEEGEGFFFAREEEVARARARKQWHGLAAVRRRRCAIGSSSGSLSDLAETGTRANTEHGVFDTVQKREHWISSS